MGFPTKKNAHFGGVLVVPPLKETPIQSPKLAGKNATCIQLIYIYIANWMIIRYLPIPPIFREPGFTPLIEG